MHPRFEKNRKWRESLHDPIGDEDIALKLTEFLSFKRFLKYILHFIPQFLPFIRTLYYTSCDKTYKAFLVIFTVFFIVVRFYPSNVL